ncbi:hypothetical protein MPL3365_10007 [Mesorhizobium plurifarium]|uniref:Uncharacterized protein n=1 Tax=Mesorhizobium plurifarium TaxID=69974 RepID=A0A090FST7_MESPL|nr:hypothetical protein MPL3365_10007 [Mesorhizobium plurifarium]
MMAASKSACSCLSREYSRRISACSCSDIIYRLAYASPNRAGWAGPVGDRRAALITFHFVVECYHVAFDIEIGWWQTIIVPSQSQPAVEAPATAAIEETMKGRTNHVSCIPS